MKSSSRRSLPLLLPPASRGGAARCRNTIFLSPSRWYLTLPARFLAEPPGENTAASRIRSASRAALPAPPTKPTTTTPPSWDGEAEVGGGVRESTRTAGEGLAALGGDGDGGGGSIVAGGEVVFATDGSDKQIQVKEKKIFRELVFLLLGLRLEGIEQVTNYIGPTQWALNWAQPTKSSSAVWEPI